MNEEPPFLDLQTPHAKPSEKPSFHILATAMTPSLEEDKEVANAQKKLRKTQTLDKNAKASSMIIHDGAD